MEFQEGGGGDIQIASFISEGANGGEKRRRRRRHFRRRRTPDPFSMAVMKNGIPPASLCGGDGCGLSGQASRLLGPLSLVLGANLLLAQLVVSLGESKVLEELPVHAVLAGVTMGLGLLDTVAVVLPVLIVMRIIL